MKILFTACAILMVAIALVGGYLAFVGPRTCQMTSNSLVLFSDEERRELSYSLADLLWSNLNNYSPHYDLTLVLERLKELSNQKVSPRTSREYQQMLLTVLEKTRLNQAKMDLQKTEELLKALKGKPGVTEVIEGKLYYEQLQPGDGPAVTLQSSPTIHYVESSPQGEVRSTRKQDQAIKVSLGDTLRGFALGVEGMRVGERRRIYVHPDLAYGKLVEGAPQELVTFEVHVIAL